MLIEFRAVANGHELNEIMDKCDCVIVTFQPIPF